MIKKSKIPVNCPSCSSRLRVSNLRCSNCETEVRGEYDLPLPGNLSQDEQDFIFNFVIFSGSLKKMSKHLNLSYPTVRNMLDEIIAKVKKHDDHEKKC